MADEVVPGGSSVDTSGFVDHLRLVHFTVCLTCFVAIIAIASQSVSSASRAYDQTNVLLRLADKWRNGEWLDEFIGRYGLANPRFEALVEVEGRPAETLFFVPPPDSLPLRTERDLLGMGERSWLGLASKKGDGFTLLDDAARIAGFKTVADAESIWNTLNEFRYVLKPFQARDGWLVEYDDHSVREVKLNSGAAVPIAKPGGELGSKSGQQLENTIQSAWVPRNYIPGHFADLSQNFIGAISKLVQSDRADAYFVMVDSVFPYGVNRAWVLRADDSTEMVDLEARLGELIVPADFPPGDFNHSFPDVSELAKNLKTLSLAELQTFFQAEKDKTGDKIEFPLVKLPAESFANWGTATIFLLTVYWFAVFRDFRLRVTPDDKAWSAAWIGISREFWSKSLFIATTLIPPSAAAYIIFFGINRQLAWSPRAAVTAAVFLAVALPTAGIVYSWIRIQRIGGTLPLTNSR